MRIWIPFLKLTASLPLKMGWEFLLSLANRNFLLIWIAFLWKIVPWMPDKKIVKKHGDLGVKDLMIYVRFSWIMRYQHLTKSGDSPKQNMRKDGVSSVSSRSICESLQVVFKMKKLHTTTPTLPKINLESSPAAEVNLFFTRHDFLQPKHVVGCRTISEVHLFQQQSRCRDGDDVSKLKEGHTPTPSSTPPQDMVQCVKIEILPWGLPTHQQKIWWKTRVPSIKRYTLQGPKISHLWKRKIILKGTLGSRRLVPMRVYIIICKTHEKKIHKLPPFRWGALSGSGVPSVGVSKWVTRHGLRHPLATSRGS